MDLESLQTSVSDASRATLTKYGPTLVSDVILAMKSANRFGTGRMASTIKAEVVEAASEISLNLTGDVGVYFADQGRGPGKRPPISVIEGWMKAKGFSNSKGAAFGIATNIGKFGIQPALFIDTGITTFKPKLLKELARISAINLKKNIESK